MYAANLAHSFMTIPQLKTHYTKKLQTVGNDYMCSMCSEMKIYDWVYKHGMHTTNGGTQITLIDTVQIAKLSVKPR